MPRFNGSVQKSKGTMMQLKKKTKTRAELRNEMFDPREDVPHGDTEMGAVEEYDWSDDGHDAHEDESTASPVLGQKRGRSAVSKSKEDGALRRRGPLDLSLTTGKYKAAARAVEGKMDDIFGGLDMADIDAEADEEVNLDELYSDEDEEGPDYSDGDDEADESEEDERHARAPPSKKRKLRTKDLTEDQYVAWLEKKEKRKKGKLGADDNDGDDEMDRYFEGGDDDDLAEDVEGSENEEERREEAEIIRQVEQLRQSHLSLVNHQQDGGEQDSSSRAADLLQKQQQRTQETIRHYMSLYSQLLKLRVKMQPAVTTAIRLPQYYALPLFCSGVEGVGDDVDDATNEAAGAPTEAGEAAAGETPSGEQISELYDDIHTLLEDILQSLMRDNATDRKKKQKKRNGQVNTIEFAALARFHQDIMASANECLDYWGSKLLRGGSGASPFGQDGDNAKTAPAFQSIAQSLPKQIAAILARRGRLRLKVQRNRSHLGILGHPEHVSCWLPSGGIAGSAVAAKTARANHLVDGDADEEIFDDADYLRECVRRSGTSAALLGRQLQSSEDALRPSASGARKGFHKLTKGRTVSYEVRPKLVGFMVAEPFEGSGRNDVIVRSLFQ